MKRIVMLVMALALVACVPADTNTQRRQDPAYEVQCYDLRLSNTNVAACSFRLPDEPKCIAIVAYSGAGVSCEW